MIDPPRWTKAQFEAHRQKAIAIFRKERLDEPVSAYAGSLDEQVKVVSGLLKETADLSRIEEDAALKVLTDSRYLLAFRYLSGPPISEDDLKTLAEASSLAPSQLQSDPESVLRLVRVVLDCIDERRFPWLRQKRKPTAAERDAAILASACLMAYQRIQTARRKTGKTRLEGATKECLLSLSFKETKPRDVHLLSDAPSSGEFCGECSCAGRRADFVVGLRDGRHLFVECKDSNSLVNSIKRLNNDTAAKAAFWLRTFGERAVIPAAVLSGVFYNSSLVRAQEQGLTVFWEHDMKTLKDWLQRAGPLKR